MNMKTRPSTDMLMFLVLFLAPMGVLARSVGQSAHRAIIQDMVKDTATADGRVQAVGALLRIVQDSSQDNELRSVAVATLGELGAAEAKDFLKDLYGRLQWDDASRQLKRIAAVAYWKIMVKELGTAKEQENLLIKLLWSENHPAPYADLVPWWAAEELANRGIKRALPEIEKSITNMNSTGIAKKFIRLCQVKIELQSASPTWLEALRHALGNKEEGLVRQSLVKWAVSEMCKIRSDETRAILVNHALGLEDQYYDRDARLKLELLDDDYMHAVDCYNSIIRALIEVGLDRAQIKATGLRPDKCFVAM